MTDLYWILTGAIFLVAALYSSVGHGGASGYIAVLVMAGYLVQDIRSFVLVLNILVSFLSFYQFKRAGYLEFRLTWPFVLAGIPFSFLGGALHLNTTILTLFLGIILIFSAIRLMFSPAIIIKKTSPSWVHSLGIGAFLGFLAGMTGTGGGIFLTPLLILFGWALPQVAAATSALFIFMNSICGLAGFIWNGGVIGLMEVEWIIAAYVGGWVGSTVGSRYLSAQIVRMILALVLLIAAFKLLRVL